MHDTLVLDLAGNPIGVISWQRAVKMYWEDRVDIVTEDQQGRILHSPSFEMGMPRVVRAKNYVVKRMRKSVPCSRRNVAIRDRSLCQYCGTLLHLSEYTLDHVIPRSKGGTTTWENTVLACVECNHRKDGRTPAEAGMRLLHAPIEPKATEKNFFKLHIRKLRPEWEPWSSWFYWNAELDH
jgi:5-methylcytosine-specific restriction endonuclease McrA